MPGGGVKDKYLCDALAIDEGQHSLYLALVTSVDQSLSVYDAMKRALQPDGSCSQGQYSSVLTAMLTPRNQITRMLSPGRSSPIPWLRYMKV